MKRILVLVAAGLIMSGAQAQNEEADAVVLPDDAQKCVLPASPDAIPENASLDQLKGAKQDIADFQTRLVDFGDCLAAAEVTPDLTAGNKQAIVASYNYSVEMEERVAQRFNDAVADYQARTAAAEG